MSKNPISEKFIEDLGLIHIEIEKLEKNKKWVYIYSLIYLLIGCILIISERDFLIDFNFSYSRYLKLLGSILILFLGFGLVILAINKLGLHFKKTKMVKGEKDKMRTVLDKYQIKYSCKVKFGRKHHGKQDVIVELKSDSDLLKKSKVKYEI